MCNSFIVFSLIIVSYMYLSSQVRDYVCKEKNFYNLITLFILFSIIKVVINMKKFKYNNAINYSGYREGQSPLTQTYPSKEEILEDLLILKDKYYYLRIYDCSPHAYRTLEVINENNLPFQVMLGLSMRAEINHTNHDFFYLHSDEQLRKNKTTNQELIQEIITLAKQYKDIVSAISIGNETRSIWNNNRVSIERLVRRPNKSNKELPCLLHFVKSIILGL